MGRLTSPGRSRPAALAGPASQSALVTLRKSAGGHAAFGRCCGIAVAWRPLRLRQRGPVAVGRREQGAWPLAFRGGPGEHLQDAAGLACGLACLPGSGAVLLALVRMAGRKVLAGAGNLIFVGGNCLQGRPGMIAQVRAPLGEPAWIGLPVGQAPLGLC